MWRMLRLTLTTCLASMTTRRATSIVMRVREASDLARSAAMASLSMGFSTAPIVQGAQAQSSREIAD